MKKSRRSQHIHLLVLFLLSFAGPAFGFSSHGLTDAEAGFIPSAFPSTTISIPSAAATTSITTSAFLRRRHHLLRFPKLPVPFPCDHRRRRHGRARLGFRSNRRRKNGGKRRKKRAYHPAVLAAD